MGLTTDAVKEVVCARRTWQQPWFHPEYLEHQEAISCWLVDVPQGHDPQSLLGQFPPHVSSGAVELDDVEFLRTSDV